MVIPLPEKTGNVFIQYYNTVYIQQFQSPFTPSFIHTYPMQPDDRRINPVYWNFPQMNGYQKNKYGHNIIQ